jgi:hypothetical protein
MENLPDWVIVIIGLGAGGLFTILGYVVNGLLEQRREKIRLAYEDVQLIRESIANTYVESAIRPIQRDLASNLGVVVEEMRSKYIDLLVWLESAHYSDDFIELLDKISASKLQWDRQARAIGIARLELFGDEFPRVALAGYRAIELYYKLARLMANDLKDELQTKRRLSKEIIEKTRDLNEDELYQPCVDTVLSAIRDLDLLGQAIPAIEMESHFDVMIAKWEEIEPLVTLRKLAKKDSEVFEKLESKPSRKRKRGN